MFTDDYKLIQDQRVSLGDQNWHALAECFKCWVCGHSLIGRVLHSHWSRSIEILCSDWWNLTMLAPRSMP